jgi:hypothetical protein
MSAHRSISGEKRIHSVKVSVGEQLYRTLQDLAARSDRSLSDYINHRLILDTFGEYLALREAGPADSLGLSDPD